MSDHPLKGVWVRCLRTDQYGYISHVEEDHEGRKMLWIVYPPARLDDGTKVKTWTAGSAYADEVKRQKWPRSDRATRI